MSKEIYISSTPHETRLAIVENDALTEIYYERENEYTLAGSIYNGKVTRVLPGMQSSFVDIGLERDAFLYITDFMEEAGDSADFDTNGNGESRRRSSATAPAAPPPSKAPWPPPPTSPLSGPTAAIVDEATEAVAVDVATAAAIATASLLRTPSVPLDAQEASFTSGTDFTAESTPIARTDESEFGEGAPGADGSRRWRGRRGRRRGRGPGQRDESIQSSSTQTPGVPVDSTYEAPSDTDFDESFDIDGAAAPIADVAPAIEATGETPANTFRGDRNRGNDRGDRGDRNRGGRDRGDRNRSARGGDRGGRETRFPRGFAPKTSLYGVDDAPAYNESPELGANAAEPIVLPGESLSKYRKPSDEPVASVAATAQAIEPNVIIPSAPAFTIPAGWDGGATLPGESLSRHRRSEERNDSRASYRQETRADYRKVTPEPQALPVAEAAPVAEPVEPGEPIIETAHTNQPEPTPEAPVEYEPTEASVSYRFDPVAVSEFRQSAPVLDAPEIEDATETEETTEAAETVETPEAFEAVEESLHATTHSITPSPEEHVTQLHTESVHERFDWQTPSTRPSSTN